MRRAAAALLLAACAPAPVPTAPSPTPKATASPPLAPPSTDAPAPAPEPWPPAAERCSDDVTWSHRPATACIAPDGSRLWAAAITFEPDKRVIESSAFAALDAVAALLRRHPQIAQLEIQGHLADDRGEEYGLRLSDARADAVRNYLVDAGVDPARLVARGYGATMPIADPRTAHAAEVNARIELVVIPARGP